MKKIIFIVIGVIAAIWLSAIIWNAIKIDLECKQTLKSIDGKVVFVSDDGIYLIQKDEIGLFRTSGLSPRISPEGERIGLIDRNGNSPYQIYIINVKDKNVEGIINVLKEKGKGYYIEDLDWSLNRKDLFFTTNKEIPQEKIGVCNLFEIVSENDMNIKRLTKFTEDRDVDRPRYSPEGNAILFVSTPEQNQKSGSDIFLLTLTDNAISNLTNSRGGDFDPSWSPDGKKIIFASMRAKDVPHAEIYLMDADGSNVKRITNNRWHDANPCFSPDGKRIVFSSYRHGSSLLGAELFVMNADGSNIKRLTYPRKVGTPPRWATDRDPDWHE